MQQPNNSEYAIAIRWTGVVCVLLTLGLGGCLSTLSTGGAPATQVYDSDREYRDSSVPTPTLLDFRFQFPNTTDNEAG